MNFYILSLIKAGLVAFIFMTTLAYLQWIERKVIAHVQLRVGPRRVGPHGLLQPLADVVKLLTKEDMLPSHVNKVFYFLAPFVAVAFALTSISVIPFGTEINVGGVHTMLQLTDLNIGVLFILGLSGMGVYGVALAGWASNNKYSLMGGLRSSAQMISYELSLGLSVIGILMIFSSVRLGDIVLQQGELLAQIGPVAIPKWGVFVQPLGFLIFLVSGYAETNRLPFDLPEGESEIVAGYHLEYGYSTMGYEVAGGMGVAMAEPGRRVYVMVGDGSWLMLSAEIATAVQEAIPLTVVLLDNHGFRCIGNLATSCGGERTFQDFRMRDSATGSLTGTDGNDQLAGRQGDVPDTLIGGKGEILRLVVHDEFASFEARLEALPPMSPLAPPPFDPAPFVQRREQLLRQMHYLVEFEDQ